MIVAAVTDVPWVPSLGSIMGSTGSQAVLQAFNQESGSGVIFGQASDPYQNRYNNFMGTVFGLVDKTAKVVRNAANILFDRDVIKEIDSEEKLSTIPTCMHVAIVTYQPIREVLDKGLIHGFGIDPKYLPKEDAVGRLIDNGKFTWTQGEPKPEYIEYHFKSTDPVYEVEDLEKIETSREFIAKVLMEQMMPGSERKDPTDWNGGQIGKLK